MPPLLLPHLNSLPPLYSTVFLLSQHNSVLEKHPPITSRSPTSFYTPDSSSSFPTLPLSSSSLFKSSIIPSLLSPMSFVEDLWSLLRLERPLGNSNSSGPVFQYLRETMTNSSCGGTDLEICRNDSAAFVLKFVAIASILISGMTGIALPLFGKHRCNLRTDGGLFFAAKAFAAGVILATGFVHMLSDSSEALTNPCLPKSWSKFPFTGFFAMISALLTLLVDFVGTQYYERKQRMVRGAEIQGRVGTSESGMESGTVPVVEVKDLSGKVFGEEGGGMHIVGMRAHAAHHRHNHPQGHDACQGGVKEQSLVTGHGHSHSHGFGDDEDEDGVRHVVVSQVLELGIVSHSVIIGLSLGVSQSPCTIRPLIAALSFHQFFEGFALGGCISQAQFKASSATMMACFFALTTPLGIGIGTAIASSYNPYSSGALITEGILDALSAGILVYMALVDLIAADFLSKRMSCNFRLQIASYCMLFLGAGLMASLALWA